MLIAEEAAAGMRGVPPAVDKTSYDCDRDEKREPAARSVEKSFPLDFPPGQSQTEQAKDASTTHTNQGKSKSRSHPEGDQEGEGKKEKGREAGKPDI